MLLPPGSLPWFLFLSSSVSTLLEALELSTGPESDRINSDIAIVGRLGTLRNPGPEKGSDNLKSHGESVGSRMGLEPRLLLPTLLSSQS